MIQQNYIYILFFRFLMFFRMIFFIIGCNFNLCIKLASNSKFCIIFCYGKGFIHNRNTFCSLFMINSASHTAASAAHFTAMFRAHFCPDFSHICRFPAARQFIKRLHSQQEHFLLPFYEPHNNSTHYQQIRKDDSLHAEPLRKALLQL